jgi:hypothetical protein
MTTSDDVGTASLRRGTGPMRRARRRLRAPRWCWPRLVVVLVVAVLVVLSVYGLGIPY